MWASLSVRKRESQSLVVQRPAVRRLLSASSPSVPRWFAWQVRSSCANAGREETRATTQATIARTTNTARVRITGRVGCRAGVPLLIYSSLDMEFRQNNCRDTLYH